MNEHLKKTIIKLEAFVGYPIFPTPKQQFCQTFQNWLHPPRPPMTFFQFCFYKTATFFQFIVWTYSSFFQFIVWTISSFFQSVVWIVIIILYLMGQLMWLVIKIMIYVTVVTLQALGYDVHERPSTSR
jgi:hypothetical protein